MRIYKGLVAHVLSVYYSTVVFPHVAIVSMTPQMRVEWNGGKCSLGHL